MHNYCPVCNLWLPDGLKKCPVCNSPPKKRTTTMERIFYAVIAAAACFLVLALLFPGPVFSFLQGIDIEFVEIPNGSDALLAKLGLEKGSQALREWEMNLSATILENVDPEAVRRIVEPRVKNKGYLEKVDILSNFVTANIRYSRSKRYTNVTEILYRFVGDDLSHVILLASMFNASGIDFRIDIVEDGTKGGRGFHYRILVLVTSAEDQVREIVTKRVRKERSGMAGTKAKVWYVGDRDFRWYVIDTTGQTIKRKNSLFDTSWIFLGSSHEYYARRSHYNLTVLMG